MSDSDHQHSSTKPNESMTEQQEPSSPKHQGIINFEKCLSKLEMNLTKAIAQRRSENSRRKIERWSKDTSLPSPQASGLTTSSPAMTPPTSSTPSNSSSQNHHRLNSPSSSSPSNPGTPTTTTNTGFSIEDNKIPLVEALFDLIEKNYVDSSTQIECNIPPSNMSLVPGLTTSEALSKEYGPLVRDFVQMRKRWHRARFETDSVPGSRSRASSVASSSNYAGSQVSRSTAKSGGSTFAKSKFGKSKIAPTSPVHPEQNMDDDDQQQQQLLQQQQEQRPEAEVEYLRRTQEERLQRYKEIGEQANEVKTLQSDINTLVGEQQQPLDTIEKNVEKAAEKTQKGREEIFKAVKYSTFGAGFLGGVVGGLVAGPAGMLLGAQSGLAIAASTGTGAVIGGVVTHKMSNKALDGSKDAETDKAFEELKRNVGGGSKSSAAASSSASSEKK